MTRGAINFVADWVRENISAGSLDERTTSQSQQMAQRLRFEARYKGISDLELNAAAVALGEPNLAAFISGAIEDATVMAVSD